MPEIFFCGYVMPYDVAKVICGRNFAYKKIGHNLRFFYKIVIAEDKDQNDAP